MTERRSPQTDSRPFYGWVIVATCFVQLTFSAGLGFYGLPIYLKELNAQRGFSVSALSLATALFWVAVGFTGVVVARLIARFDPRWVIGTSGLIGALAIIGLGRFTELWQIMIVYVVFGIGFTGTAVLVANTLVTRWFHVKRSIAMSISATGLSFGGIVLTPIAARLLQDRPIADATVIIAAMFAAGTVLLSALLLRPSPAAKGQHPDGIEPTAEQAARTVAPGYQFAPAVSSVAFKAITACFTLALLGQVGGISQLVKLATERAGSPTNTQVISALAACSVFGRLSGGVIVTKLSSRRFAYLALALQASGLFVLAFAQSRLLIMLGACVFGLGVGNVLLLHPLLLAEAFGVRDYGPIYARSSIFISAGNAVGPLAMGYARDHLGGYQTAYLIAFSISLVGFAIYRLFGTPPPEIT
jgi:MFS family permease